MLLQLALLIDYQQNKGRFDRHLAVIRTGAGAPVGIIAKNDRSHPETMEDMQNV